MKSREGEETTTKAHKSHNRTVQQYLHKLEGCVVAAVGDDDRMARQTVDTNDGHTMVYPLLSMSCMSFTVVELLEEGNGRKSSGVVLDNHW